MKKKRVKLALVLHAHIYTLLQKKYGIA